MRLRIVDPTFDWTTEAKRTEEATAAGSGAASSDATRTANRSSVDQEQIRRTIIPNSVIDTARQVPASHETMRNARVRGPGSHGSPR